MVSTSKILTVSYGTFSCTLEGFDDSFETMKAIAEYFRDLASEDRYFGAEPPVPDAEMLARIAEREIARRVEAREERGGIVLRAAPYGAVAAPLAPQAAPAAAQAPAAQAPVVQTEVAPEAPQMQPAATTAPDIAAAPVAETETVAQVAETQNNGADDWEDVALDDFSVETASVAPMATQPLRHTPVPHPDPESVAAKLQRIRDVVTKSAATPAPEAYSEDEHAESFLTETAQSFEAALELDDQASTDEMDGDDDEIAALLSRLAGEDKAEREATPAPAEPVAADIDLREFDETEFDDVAQTEDAPSAPDVVEDDLQAETAEADEVEAEEAEPDTEAEVEEPQTATPSRVIKIKRAELEEAIAKGKLEPVEDDLEDTQSEEDAPVARLDPLQMVPRDDLSPEDEAELRRELAAVEAELLDLNRDTNAVAAKDDDLEELEDDSDDDEDVTSLFEDDEDEDDAPLVLRDPRDQLVKVKAEDDMSRLLAKAENALTEPESASRRNAIAHLRAAVAATKAEQSAGTTSSRDPSYSSFRDDLDNVVRPRRPVGEAAGATARPSEQRPAPLKLVAEQRVDLPQTRPSEQVRPRRVSLAPMPDDAADTAPATTATVSEGGFDEFARKMGATALPDLLEAAAAYLVHVEGRAEFSRPQLMTKARQAAGKSLSREDGLRSFGQLLRQGKIQKIRSGRFTASDDISFKPAARRVG